MRTNAAFELARMMIKQAKMLKSSGFYAEARGLARRALAVKDFAHLYHADLQPQPVRITNRRR